MVVESTIYTNFCSGSRQSTASEADFFKMGCCIEQLSFFFCLTVASKLFVVGLGERAYSRQFIYINYNLLVVNNSKEQIYRMRRSELSYGLAPRGCCKNRGLEWTFLSVVYIVYIYIYIYLYMFISH